MSINCSSRLTIFRLHLDRYDFKIKHTPLKSNTTAYVLNRITIDCRKRKEFTVYITRRVQTRTEAKRSTCESIKINSTTVKADEYSNVRLMDAINYRVYEKGKGF